MGDVFISLDDTNERLLRELARREGGKKGALSSVVAQALQELAKKKKRLKAAYRQVALMETGFDFGLGTQKAYAVRGGLYD